MSYLVLARKYRPEKFSEVLGQQHITRTLTRSIENDRLGHAFLFSGPRGIGKTTTARLLAKAVNCTESEGAEPCNSCSSCQQIQAGNDVDVMEIDGASNNSVDQVRDLRENVQYAPAQNEKKIYIIDEVHMLSRAAFNALLKTLEEPPDHVIFIFATTEIDKVPDTIRSRCQRFDFRLIPQKTIVDCLEGICEKEDIPAEKEALFLIAKFAEGSLRDAQSILDQMINFTGAGEDTITQQLVSETWGLAPYDKLIELMSWIAAKNTDEVLKTIHEHLEAGKDLMALVADLAEMSRNCLLIKKQPDASFFGESLPDRLISRLEEVSDQFSETELSWIFDQLLSLHSKLQQHSRFRTQLLEIGFIKIIRGRPKYNLGEIIDRLEKIEGNGEQATGTGKQSKKDLKSAKRENKSTAKKNKPEKNKSKTKSKQQKSKNTIENQWKNILNAIPNPIQAYLRNCSKIQEKQDRLIIWFNPRWENHVEKLKSPENRKKLVEAIKEKTGLERDIEIKTGKTEKTTEKKSGTQKKSKKQSKNKDLLKETKEIFDVEEVTVVED